MVHVGIGYDIHPLVFGRKLVLGGVILPYEKGLEGHSDADVLMHAICDALLGALGQEDIGHFFPNTDARWKNAASKVFLEEAARQVAFQQGRLVNIDATVLAEEPKIYPHIKSMKENIAGALNVNIHRIGLKATTNERLGSLGRGEGIAAMAVASVDLPEVPASETRPPWPRRKSAGRAGPMTATNYKCMPITWAIVGFFISAAADTTSGPKWNTPRGRLVGIARRGAATGSPTAGSAGGGRAY